ncbi:bactofilin family protein [Sulfurirhabdus autotrophica]|uniref:Cytoskeletal protein CcmA (Bactofilin family) n=1 Tax=Sulfurirhabdus autotrophica TaxID=1706046 RepID=A0A4R3YBC5_9PROT|nr:polymer-forming cytoskeletal protein [Sulfurirhabdus autotrophica]TCV89031.1 cytoskeletal protein CcmA (bactofilin family) [Sulfurirhabdus autotrophica]
MLRNFMQPTTKNNLSEAITIVEKQVEARQETSPPAPKPAPREEGNKLTVGPNIKLKGSEITDCEILVVEGRVEASMNSRDIRIAEGGVFSGKAEIDVAEIRGSFEGELTARKQLVIYSTGKVTGTIRYGALTIEEGGVIEGEVAAISKGTQSAKTVNITEQQIKAVPSPSEKAKTEHIYASSVLGRTPLGGRRG